MSKAQVGERMEQTLDIWLANPTASNREIAALAGISESTFARYRQDKAFMENYDKRCREWFDSLQALAINTMREATAQGNIQAAKYLLDNKYAPSQHIDINTNDIKITISNEEE